MSPAADDPLLAKVRYEQVRAGLTARNLISEKIEIGNWTPSEYGQLKHLTSDVYHAAAERKTTPSGRVRCLEARVVAFKENERFSVARFEVGNEPAQNVCMARFHRLEAEAELHELNESLLPPCSVTAPPVAPPVVIWCVPACPPQPRYGLFRRR